MTHTPGPWEARSANHLSDGGLDWGIGAVVDGKKYCIAEAPEVVGLGVKVDAAANAALIAAAPDLYEALAWLLKEADEIEDRFPGILDRARAALAKARSA